MKDKAELLKGLLLTEEDTLEKFSSLVNKSKKLFGIEGKTKKIIFHNSDLLIKEKIVLLLIGKYFAKELDLIESSKMELKDISEELRIIITSLTAPIKSIINLGYIDRIDGLYGIRHYKIEDIIDRLNLKYDNPQKTITPGLEQSGKKRVEKTTKTKKKTISKSGSKKTKKRQKIQVPDRDFNKSPKNIEDLARDLETTIDNLRIVFDFDDDSIHLLRKKHCDKDSEENFYNSIIILTGLFYKNYKREINVNELKKLLSGADVTISRKFTRDMNLSARRIFIFKKGKQYKITDSGIKLGLSIIDELING